MYLNHVQKHTAYFVLVFRALCICVFVYLCICVFVYLCVDVCCGAQLRDNELTTNRNWSEAKLLSATGTAVRKYVLLFVHVKRKMIE